MFKLHDMHAAGSPPLNKIASILYELSGRAHMNLYRTKTSFNVRTIFITLDAAHSTFTGDKSQHNTAHIVLYDVVVVAGKACPEAEVGVEAAVLWQVLPLVEAQVPLAHGPRRVAQLTQVLRQQAITQRQTVRLSCQNRYSLHACGQSQFCFTVP